MYELEKYNVVFGMKYPAPILSMACAVRRVSPCCVAAARGCTSVSRCLLCVWLWPTQPDNSRLVVGMADGMLSVKQRVVKRADALAEKRREATMRGGTYRYFLRGKSSTPAAEDIQVGSKRRVRLQPYEAFLKKFQYTNALNAALETRQPIIISSLIDELLQRDGLGIALSGRDEVALEPLVAFVAKYITHPRFSAQLIHLCNLLFGACAVLLSLCFVDVVDDVVVVVADDVVVVVVDDDHRHVRPRVGAVPGH